MGDLSPLPHARAASCISTQEAFTGHQCKETTDGQCRKRPSRTHQWREQARFCELLAVLLLGMKFQTRGLRTEPWLLQGWHCCDEA
jgi:hypothetical protein